MTTLTLLDSPLLQALASAGLFIGEIAGAVWPSWVPGFHLYTRVLMLMAIGRVDPRDDITQGFWCELWRRGIRVHEEQVCFYLQKQGREPIHAERRLGEMLEEMDLHGGDRRSTSHDASLNLSELGITYSQSHRWQTEAAGGAS